MYFVCACVCVKQIVYFDSYKILYRESWNKLYCRLFQSYLTSGDWDDVEDLSERLESYKS